MKREFHAEGGRSSQFVYLTKRSGRDIMDRLSHGRARVKGE